MMGLKNTHFDSPHGLDNLQNISTAYDMGLLVTKCMEIQIFREIVATRDYRVNTETYTYLWHSTNKLLSGFIDKDEQEIPKFEGTLGCKTGITNAAGPCFAGFFSRATL